MGVLTIAREYGSGGKEIGNAVAEIMGYRYVDRRQILEDMKSVGSKWEEVTRHFDENNPKIWERFKWSFRGYVALIQYHILKYALNDNVVIMGRGGNFLLKDTPYVLRIRTVASQEKRIEKIMQWEDINSDNAQFLIEKADKEIAGAVYLIYGFAWDDGTQYDMVFDTGLQAYDEIISIIKEELAKRENLKTDAAREILQLKTLASHIKAEIATDPKLFVSSLDVKLKEEGLVKYGLIVRGAVHDNMDIPRIKEITENLCKNIPVEYDLKFRWHSRLGPWEYK